MVVFYVAAVVVVAGHNRIPHNPAAAFVYAAVAGHQNYNHYMHQHENQKVLALGFQVVEHNDLLHNVHHTLARDAVEYNLDRTHLFFRVDLFFRMCQTRDISFAYERACARVRSLERA